MTLKVAVALGGRKDASERLYVEALRQVGLDPQPLYPGMTTEEIGAVVANSAGLVLSGGPDVHPSRYGEEPAGAELKYVSEARDTMEWAALEAADSAEAPVFAICRGMQMLNVFRGGALLQDIGKAHRDGRPQPEKWRTWHEVQVEPGSSLAAALPAGNAAINSRHHQAVDSDRIGSGLTAIGWCPADRVVEAIEGEGDRFVLGVQWHPENMAVDAPEGAPEKEQARALFAAFAQAVRAFAGTRAATG